MQELLSICDLLITDYSSSMFDFSMLRKPCIIYATDIEQYDRGYYYTFDQMPYPVARNQAELIETIRNFDLDQHLIKVDDFMSNTVGMFEDGNASRRIAAWMSEHSI
jgi:CDP-glycerol glycerophosphotransferase